MAAVLTETETLSPKLRGGYYTPAPIAQFLAEWVIRSPADRVLEPSCGDGALVEATAQRLLALGTTPISIGNQLRATELFASEARIARQRLQKLGINDKECVVVADFFSALGSAGGQLAFDTTLPALQNARFDAVIGNPPFLRFQNFPEEQRQLAFYEMHQAGLRPNRLTNAWVPFLVAAAERLTATGRLAMVIPAELLQVGYAAETRAYLARSFATVTIVTFKKLVFDTIQQEVVLLLAERGTAAAHTIDIVELEDARDLRGIASKIMVNNSHKPFYEAKDKWTLYFLEPAEIDLIQQLNNRKDIPRLGDFAKVEVGVVTGNNSFFVQSNQNIINKKIKDFAKPLVGRTAQLPGLLYTAEDHEKQCLTNTGCWILDIPAAVDLPEKMSAYIIEGEQAEVHTGYKCRIRPSWYTVPSIWTPDAFLFRQIYKAPKLVANLTRATSLPLIQSIGCDCGSQLMFNN